MLAWLGFGMVTTFMTLIMTRRLSPLVALISVPIVFALPGGFGGGGGLLGDAARVAGACVFSTVEQVTAQEPASACYGLFRPVA